jgi:CheY-like chemotaxis protein
MNGAELRHGQHKLIPTPKRRAVRVLVVNDSPDNVESMALLLRLYGHEVEVALGGVAALRAAQAQ